MSTRDWPPKRTTGTRKRRRFRERLTGCNVSVLLGFGTVTYGQRDKRDMPGHRRDMSRRT
jgi:hypothetical protein